MLERATSHMALGKARIVALQQCCAQGTGLRGSRFLAPYYQRPPLTHTHTHLCFSFPFARFPSGRAKSRRGAWSRGVHLALLLRSLCLVFALPLCCGLRCLITDCALLLGVARQRCEAKDQMPLLLPAVDSTIAGGCCCC